jgi:hypothetical protein
MFVTLDVVFHEDSMYFSSDPELQGEYQEEVQTLNYDVHIFEEGELFEPGKQDAGELDLSGITLDQSGDKHSESSDVVMNTQKVVLNAQKLKLWLHLRSNPSHHRQLIRQTNRSLRMFLI